jgi:hypothetical protein
VIRKVDLGCEIRQTPERPPGPQQSVLQAIREGMRTVDDIRLLTRLDEAAVRNAIRRLLDAGEVRRLNFGGYGPVDSGCRLAEHWRGVTA